MIGFTAPAMFSWKITLVPLRKFFPMIKTSSPPLTEQLWRLFFKISGTPAGWAEVRQDNLFLSERKIKQKGHLMKTPCFISSDWCTVSVHFWWILCLNYSLQRMGDDGTCRVRTDPSGWGMATRKANLARVLFFFDPATPIRASTSALRSFKIPTQSTL